MRDSQEAKFNTFSKEELEPGSEHWPRISENQLAYLDTIGGYYRGFVEGSEGRRYEDIWHDVKAAYDLSSSKFTKISVETRAYGRGALQDESQVEGYTVSITFEMGGGPARTFNFDVNDPAVSESKKDFHALADMIHHYIVHDLNTLPRSKGKVQREIDRVMDEWKTGRGYVSEGMRSIHDPGL